MSRFFGAVAIAAAIMAAAAIVYGFLAYGPSSLRAEYRRDARDAVAGDGPGPLVTEADLAHLPNPVARYLRAAGVVGQPRVHRFKARMHGRLRSGPNAPWMPFTAEQYNVVAGSHGASRFFYMTATRAMVPFQAYHRYTGAAATMRVKVAAMVSVVDVAGPEMTRAETVTLFNDLCIMAPAALLDAAVVWTPIDAHRVGASFTNAGYTIHADLVFGADGRLVDFVSDDRLRASDDGQTLTPLRWSTPLRAPRSFGAVRLASGGEARWHEPGGTFAYIELELDTVDYHPSTP